MDLTDEEKAIHDAAMDHARASKKKRCAELTDPNVFRPEDHPVSVFMAGSPGAGKTESSKELIAEFEGKSEGTRILRIDPDDLRCEFPGYSGANSRLFQGAVSIYASKMVDLAIDQSQTFVLDGTLSDYDRATKNITRCIGHDRTVQILYVYQDPLLAWRFVQAREAREGRNIPVERFVEQYFGARDVVNRLKAELGAQIKVDLLFKPIDGSPKIYRAGIDRIDGHVSEKYDRAGLAELLLRG